MTSRSSMAAKRSAPSVLARTTSGAQGWGCATLIPDGEYCEDCYPEEEYDDGYSDYDLIHSWDYTPSLQFHGEGPLFLGIELEMSAPWGRRDDTARIAQEYLGDLGYLKSDGSWSTGSSW